MAKKDKDAIYQDYLAELKTLVGDEKWGEVEEALIKNEKASAKLREGVLARSEFSSGMDALRQERQEFEGTVKAENEKIRGWQKWYGDVSKEAVDLQNTVKAYQNAYGDLEDGNTARKPAGISEEDFQKRLNDAMQQYSSAAVTFADDLTEIKLNHRDRFKETLNVQDVIKLVGEKNIPLKTAYNEYIADKVEAVRQTEFDEAVKRAREEGAQEALSRHNLPNIPNNPTIVHTVDAMKETPTSARDRVAAAVKGFNEGLSRQR